MNAEPICGRIVQLGLLMVLCTNPLPCADCAEADREREQVRRFLARLNDPQRRAKQVLEVAR